MQYYINVYVILKSDKCFCTVFNIKVVNSYYDLKLNHINGIITDISNFLLKLYHHECYRQFTTIPLSINFLNLSQKLQTIVIKVNFFYNSMYKPFPKNWKHIFEEISTHVTGILIQNQFTAKDKNCQNKGWKVAISFEWRNVFRQLVIY